MDIHARLADRRRYERQIERLHQRYLLTSRLYEMRQSEVSLASIVMHRGKVARLLAREVAAGRYELEPGELRTIRARHKMREVFACRITDLIVHGVVADVVQEAMEPELSPRVFSYRKGLSWLTPISELAAYIRGERRKHLDPRARGTYVLRRDVDSYTDSIPIGGDSLLWPMLEAAFGAPLPSLVEQVVRVEMRMPGGGVACRVRGLPMGQPIASIVANVYLGEMDRALEAIPGGFYARYGDDFLFAHPDPAVTREAARVSDLELSALSLTVNEKKRRTLFLTPAGRPSEQWPEAQGTSGVPFLGTRIAADGTVGLEEKKVRSLLRELDRRTTTTVRTLRGADRERAGRAVCSVVNRALDPRSALTQQRSALALRRVVTDRRQLEQLDYWIARIVLKALTGRSEARAFREVPYRRLRTDWGLVSLVAARNDVARRAA
ncbi:MAG: reverse transcriptase domain-containing protein [Gaiellaceae bacterium]